VIVGQAQGKKTNAARGTDHLPATECGWRNTIAPLKLCGPVLMLVQVLNCRQMPSEREKVFPKTNWGNPSRRGSASLAWAAVLSVVSSSGPRCVVWYLIGRSGRKVAGQPHHRYCAVLGGGGALLKIGKHGPCLSRGFCGICGNFRFLLNPRVLRAICSISVCFHCSPGIAGFQCCELLSRHPQIRILGYVGRAPAVPVILGWKTLDNRPLPPAHSALFLLRDLCGHNIGYSVA